MRGSPGTLITNVPEHGQFRQNRILRIRDVRYMVGLRDARRETRGNVYLPNDHLGLDITGGRPGWKRVPAPPFAEANRAPMKERTGSVLVVESEILRRSKNFLKESLLINI